MIHFWKTCPALRLGLFALLGCAAALDWHWALLLPIPLLSNRWTALAGGLMVAIAAFAYTQSIYPSYELDKKISGTAYFRISSVSVHASPFQRSFQYKGVIESFHSKEGRKLHRLPCRIYLPLNGERPAADTDYLIEGTLCEKGPRNYHFKPASKKGWRPISGTSSLAEWRFHLKEKWRASVKKHLSNGRSYAFLTALFTGDIDERSLTLEFSHLGLQHILAISGFHFALLAAFCGVFLRLFLGPKTTAAFLIAALSSYFFFIGNAPSVQRGWLAILIFLIGYLFNLRTSGLNALGCSLIVSLAIDPLISADIGFQLSYLSTAAILLSYPTLNNLLSRIFPKRPLSAIASMPPLDQHGYIFSALLREALAINFAVHLFVVPALLFLFHKFPLLSLFYNLFFPFWANLLFLLLLASILFSFLIPPLGHLLHALNNNLSAILLEFTAHPPALLDFFIRVPAFPFELLILILCALFAGAIALERKLNPI